METQNQQTQEDGSRFTQSVNHHAGTIDNVNEFPQMQTSSLAAASQMYMWETLIPGEEDDFEEDFIASTNEKLYVAPLTRKQVEAAFDDDDSFMVFDPLQEMQEIRRGISSRERESDFNLELQLELDMTDMEIDIFADNNANLCEEMDTFQSKKKKTPLHDYAQDSTLISFDQAMLDQTEEKAMFDQNFENMSILEEGMNNQGTISELLREKGILSRSHFISDDFHVKNLIDETPDKTCGDEEEKKAPVYQTQMIDTCNPELQQEIRGPFELMSSSLDLQNTAMQGRYERSLSFCDPLGNIITSTRSTDKLKEIMPTEIIKAPVKIFDS